MKNICIITQIWLRATCYFTCISNTWYLLTVPSMNTTNPFFSEISQQIHKSSLLTCSSYDHLHAMNDKSTTTLVCGVSYHTGALLSCYMRAHKLNLIQLAVPQTFFVFLNTAKLLKRPPPMTGHLPCKATFTKNHLC